MYDAPHCLWMLTHSCQLEAIPTVGYDGVRSYITAVQATWSSKALIEEGYRKVGIALSMISY